MGWQLRVVRIPILHQAGNRGQLKSWKKKQLRWVKAYQTDDASCYLRVQAGGCANFPEISSGLIDAMTQPKARATACFRKLVSKCVMARHIGIVQSEPQHCFANLAKSLRSHFQARSSTQSSPKPVFGASTTQL